MHEYLPLLIVGGIIGLFTIGFVVAYALVKNKKEAMGFDRNMADSEIIRRLLAYAKPYWKQFVLTLLVMLFSVVYDVVSPLLVGRIVGMVQEDFVLWELFAMVALYGSILVVSLLCTYIQAMLLQSICHSDGVHHRSQHAYIVSRGAIHASHTCLGTSPDVAATHNNGNLQIALLLSFGNLACDASHDFRGNIVSAALCTQSLTAQFEQDTLVFGRGGITHEWRKCFVGR